MTLAVSIVLGLAAVLLAASGLIALWQMAIGPSQLDRSIGADLLVAVLIGAVGVWAVARQQDTEVVAVLALSMLGFTSAVAIGRMVGERVVYRKPAEPKEKR
ncbi:monovalent cation/H+ antiporter complex subunit F [Tessaracoccus sp. OH4464_COT-324]|uniref:monovalent cation/H+ antiporter complex subunit F n=1 Tax=Tessaracoccus sp. OH4464_COT-324 TaxID=2491059 RepID=UPI000F63D116|nr:monovalent cation/H+ antiporter complex subunit F [Tessaracoccus sp. OH4464_COT-324]RRD46099.1 cation:proton antiporter [Tessaracoccus sp. OH4464_COT-324]